MINFTLSLYTPAKTALCGSVDGAANSVLIGVKDTLKAIRNVRQLHKIAPREAVQTKFQGVTLHYNLPAATLLMTQRYYLSGYIIHKTGKCTGSLDKSGLSGNVFWDALDTLKQCDIPMLGCVDHASVFTC